MAELLYSTEKSRIEQLKQLHDALFDELFDEKSRFSIIDKDGRRRKNFLRDVDDFLGQLQHATDTDINVDQYAWLSDVALKWQVAYSSILNVPNAVEIPPPPQHLKPPPRRLTDKEVKGRVEVYAQRKSENRRLDRYRDMIRAMLREPSSKDDELADWHHGEVRLAVDVLDGTIDFVTQLGSDSYKRLEGIWISEATEVKAYFIWRDEGGGIGEDIATEKYLKACGQCCQRLCDISNKVPREEFDPVRAYLLANYIDSNKTRSSPRKVPPTLIEEGLFTLKKNNDAQELIEKRAERYARIKGGEAEDHKQIARKYVELFYENIIPAVMDECQPSKDKIVEAFELSQSAERSCPIMNCFEAAIAIYFLRVDHVPICGSANK